MGGLHGGWGDCMVDRGDCMVDGGDCMVERGRLYSGEGETV